MNILGSLSASTFSVGNLNALNQTVSNLNILNTLSVGNLISNNHTVGNIIGNTISVGNLYSNKITSGGLLITNSTQNIIYINSQSSQTNPGQIVFTNTAGVGDLKITADGGDIVWQGGGGRSLQMGAFHEIYLLGGRNTNSIIPFVGGSFGAINTIVQNSSDSIGLIVKGNSSQTNNLQEFRNNSDTILSRFDNLGRLYIPNMDSAITVSTSTINTVGSSINFSRADHTHKVELITYTVSQTGEVQTTSTNDIVLQDMTLTPPSGTYLVFAYTQSSNHQNNNGIQWYSIYNGSSQVSGTLYSVSRSASQTSNSTRMWNAITTVTMNGTNTITIRWRSQSNTARTFARNLTLIRIS